MNKYLLTTAILSLGISQSAHASEVEFSMQSSVFEADFEQVLRGFRVSSRSLKNGDFLTFSRNAKNLGLYSGDGAVQMKSIRTFRY